MAVCHKAHKAQHGAHKCTERVWQGRASLCSITPQGDTPREADMHDIKHDTPTSCHTCQQRRADKCGHAHTREGKGAQAHEPVMMARPCVTLDTEAAVPTRDPPVLGGARGGGEGGPPLKLTPESRRPCSATQQPIKYAHMIGPGREREG